MFGGAGSRRLSRARRGSSPNIQPGHNILQSFKHQKGQALLNPALLDEEFQYSEHSEGKFKLLFFYLFLNLKKLMLKILVTY